MLIRVACGDDGGIPTLLAHAIGNPTAGKLADACRKYRDDPASLLLAARTGDTLAGIVGIEVADDEVMIRHIAVAPERRRGGIGRAIIEWLAAEYAPRVLIAETDGDAVGFYRRCGFVIESLGERYPGVERFRCTYRQQT